MSILVTGGAGYIGSHVVQQLLDAGEKVTVVDSLVTGFREAVPPQANFVQGDVRDGALLDNVFMAEKISTVLNFAASLIVPESVEKPLEYYENNVGGILSLLQAMKRHEVTQLVFSSTAAVYGIPESNAAITETTIKNPISPYGASKYMVESILADVATAYGLRYVALRYFNVAGADPSGKNGQRTKNATHLVKVATQTASGQRPDLCIFGTDYPTPDGTCIRDYIHVSDLASAHLAALRYLHAGGKADVMNCGYGKGASVREVVAATKRVSGVDFKVTEAPRRAGDPPTLIADCRKIHQLLDWTPQYNDLDFIVKTALDWERSQV